MNNTKKEKASNKKIRNGDKVMAIRGNERGQIGTVIRLMEDKAIVQGLNIRKKHVKKSEANPSGGIIEMEGPIHLSNLRVCVDETPVKLRIRKNDQGEREYYYIKDGKETLYRAIKGQK